MTIGLLDNVVRVLGHLWNALRCRCASDCAYNEVLAPSPISGRTRSFILESSMTSTVTKSTDPRYAGRYYIDAPDVYAARVAYAKELIADGKSHKCAWYHAFQVYPRTYLTSPDTPQSDPDACSFVFPPGLGSPARCSQSNSD